MLTKLILPCKLLLYAIRIAIYSSIFLGGAQFFILANDTIGQKSSPILIVKGDNVFVTILPYTLTNLDEIISESDSLQNTKKDTDKNFFKVFPHTQLIGGEFIHGAEIIYLEPTVPKVDKIIKPRESKKVEKLNSTHPKSFPITNFCSSRSSSSLQTSKKLYYATSNPTHLEIIIPFVSFSIYLELKIADLNFIQPHTFILNSLTNVQKVRPPPFEYVFLFV